jgi:hypothetical protein
MGGSARAVAAAARSLYRADAGWEDEGWHYYARDALAAALPVIEAAIRSKIAAEIEALDATQRDDWTFSPNWHHALVAAARVARGGFSADHTATSDLSGSDCGGSR